MKDQHDGSPDPLVSAFPAFGRPTDCPGEFRESLGQRAVAPAGRLHAIPADSLTPASPLITPQATPLPLQSPLNAGGPPRPLSPGNLDRVPLRAGHLLEQLLGRFRGRLAERRIQFETRVSGDCRVHGHADSLVDALGHLVRNALEHMGDGGSLHISVGQVLDDYVDIRIEDNGCGISDEHRERILAPFFTAVEAVAGAHDGFFWFQSQPGSGSVFALRLPALRGLQ